MQRCTYQGLQFWLNGSSAPAAARYHHHHLLLGNSALATTTSLGSTALGSAALGVGSDEEKWHIECLHLASERDAERLVAMWAYKDAEDAYKVRA